MSVTLDSQQIIADMYVITDTDMYIIAGADSDTVTVQCDTNGSTTTFELTA